MVIYFSGTGNSRHVAETLANKLHQQCVKLLDYKASDTSEKNILVCPVYSWGIAPIVSAVLEKMPKEQLPEYAVLVCGDETGEAHLMLKNLVDRLGGNLKGIWSVIMPNNYVLLPGFNVDSKEVETKKLRDCEARISHIANRIAAGAEETDVNVGPWPRLKTRLVYPLFKRWGIFASKWRYTDECISCGKCSQVCPVNNVSMQKDKEGKMRPAWGSNCTSCLACYHICPRHAVEYGSATRKKGQYFFGK